MNSLNKVTEKCSNLIRNPTYYNSLYLNEDFNEDKTYVQ